ncbi:hypothetical protein H8D57_00425 [bacterium]|nr:hypothetical protein [bacterium]
MLYKFRCVQVVQTMKQSCRSIKTFGPFQAFFTGVLGFLFSLSVLSGVYVNLVSFDDGNEKISSQIDITICQMSIDDIIASLSEKIPDQSAFGLDNGKLENVNESHIGSTLASQLEYGDEVLLFSLYFMLLGLLTAIPATEYKTPKGTWYDLWIVTELQCQDQEAKVKQSGLFKQRWVGEDEDLVEAIPETMTKR